MGLYGPAAVNRESKYLFEPFPKSHEKKRGLGLNALVHNLP
jgi:hypothetical protein